VHGATLGILGMGRIGQAIARRGALGFGMKVIYHNRSRLEPEQEAPIGARYVDKATLLRRVGPPGAGGALFGAEPPCHRRGRTGADEAHGDADQRGARWHRGRRRTGPGAGRSPHRRSRPGRVRGRAPLHPGLLQVPNVVLTPHIASATLATRMKMAMLAADNLIAVLSGGAPLTPVTPAAR
jgi:gluconate 2-dehydrogenase